MYHPLCRAGARRRQSVHAPVKQATENSHPDRAPTMIPDRITLTFQPSTTIAPKPSITPTGTLGQRPAGVEASTPRWRRISQSAALLLRISRNCGGDFA
ncbi:hypothetical protein D2T31_17225 [Sinirhodobacter populi]|uniref:Uncharacterized protein n=1 Tax=Paenirhodobacter populi TaxID=2306993 RepID=A0A443K3P2_9RHOB|nr:hypothetical protein [Sinirhodobacter populi]RWR27381.1 hypothetical protein D2T31_17225 [Sinirhodobacter populi]